MTSKLYRPRRRRTLLYFGPPVAPFTLCRGQVEDPSMLRFLVDLRGEDATDSQLRDDLMTMMIAGHETTAAVLTWAFFEMAQNPEVVRKAQEEVDRVIGDRVPTLDDIK